MMLPRQWMVTKRSVFEEKAVAVADFQFFNVARLEELRQVELRNFEYRKSIFDRRYSADPPVYDEKVAQELAPPLSEEQMEEKERLMNEGFTQWMRRDLLNFVRGCELYGRDDLPSVTTEVEGKTDKEVAQYAVVFFKR